MPNIASRLPTVVACAGHVVRAAGEHQRAILPRPAPPGRARQPAYLTRSSRSERRICSCSTFSVRSRLVSPLWMCS